MRTIGKKKEWMWAVAFLLLTAVLVHVVAGVLRPAYTTYGSTWQAFLAEPEDSLDVIYLGSSVAYCDINPTVVYQNSGLTGFVMAGGEQPLSITYWYLREILKTQSPAAVVLEGTGVFFQTYQSYTQKNISTMPNSINKLRAILTASEPELRQELLFDLSFYHERWKELGIADFELTQWDEYKGFTPMVGGMDGAGETEWVADRDIEAEVYAENLTWLEKILLLCQENEIQAIVTIHPAYSRCTPEAYTKLEEEIAEMDLNAIFCNWSANFEEIGLVPAEHLYDGMHLNQDGARVFSAWLGKQLKEEFGLMPCAQTEENAAAWQTAIEYWNEQVAA